MAYDPLSSIQAGGLLGSGQPASPGLLGGMFSGFNPQAFSQGMVDNQGALMGLASGILGGVNMRQGLAQGLQNFQQGRQGDYIRNQRTAEQAAVKGAAAADTSLTPQMRQLLTSSPEIARAYLSQNLLNPNQNKMSDLELQQKQFEVAHQGQRIPKLMEIGTNPDGSKQYGFVDELTQQIKPYTPPGGNGSLFSASSVDGQALNALVANGTITRQQAAIYAASKPSQNPATGAVSLITPLAAGGGGVPPQGGGAPPPMGGAPQPQGTPGVIDVTGGKPGGNLNETQQRAKAMTSVIAPELPIIKENFAALSDPKNQAAGMFGTAGNYVSSEGYQRARNSVAAIVRAYLYSVSGASTPTDQALAEADALMPKLGEKPSVIADKQRRIQTYADAINGWAGGNPTGQPQAPQSTALQPGQTIQHPSGVTIQRLN